VNTFLGMVTIKGVLGNLSERTCSKCGSKAFSKILQGDAESKKPFWECGDCSFQNNQVEDDKIDSFDYDQGYNLDEVYDQ